MRRLIRAGFILSGAIFTFAYFHALQAQEDVSWPGLSFHPKDRVLILAPHPDDEAIGAVGVIQKALKAGAKVKVVLFTNGDNNELAFIIYEKRITFKQKEFIHMGQVRRAESLAAMNSLGLSRDDVICLGYPDFGTLEIFTKYWGDTKPFKSMFVRKTNVPYADALSPNAPFVGESILNDLKKVLLDFKPTKILVSHPADHNRDHQALYLFLQVALWELKTQIHKPGIFPYLIHVVGWPEPRGFHPELALEPPTELNTPEIPWQKLELTQDEIKAKYDAVSYYKSQIEYDPPYLFTFARKNELFGGYPEISVKRQGAGDILWRELETGEKSTLDNNSKPAGRINSLVYAIQGQDLFIRLFLNRIIDREFGVSLFLIGYKEKEAFAKMPKIQLSVGLGGLHVKEKKQALFIKNVQLVSQHKTLTFKVPLSVLGDPDYILSCARSHAGGGLSLDETAWRILELE